MTETEHVHGETRVTTSDESDADASQSPPSVKTKVRSDGLIVWAAISIGFLAFLAFGSVDARIWRFGNLRVEPRSVLRVWTLQAETLPTVSQQWLLTSLFYTCVIVFVASSVIGIWFLLDSAGTGISRTEQVTEHEQDIS